MPRKVYTPSDHQRAFEIWYETKNLMESARQLSCEYTTVREWMKETFSCRYSCPWHGWSRLHKEREAALDARFKLVEAGNVDPVAHHQAMMEAVQQAPGEPQDSHSRRMRAVDAIVRSDLERISHFELLYAKVFQQATGLMLDHAGIHGLPEGDRFQQLKSLYEIAPLKCSTMPEAVKTLLLLAGKIKELKEDLGIQRLKGYQSDKSTVVEQVEEEEREPVSQGLTIEELRKFREMAEHTSPENMDIIKKLMRADDAQVKQILEPQPEVDAGPQKGPASPEQIDAQVKQTTRELQQVEVLTEQPLEAFTALPPPPPPLVFEPVSEPAL